VATEYVDEDTMIPQNSTVLVHRIARLSTDVIQIAGSLTDAITASYCPTPHPIDLQNFICCYSVRMEVFLVFVREKSSEAGDQGSYWVYIIGQGSHLDLGVLSIII
jgi:hypothetical protein